MNIAGFLRGMEQVFVDLITEDEAGLLMIDKFIAVHFGKLERELHTIEKLARSKGKRVNELVDFVWMGEDLGTQHGLPTMLHTCGSSSWAYEDYIKLGLKAVDTLQPEAANMSPEYLKRTFGGRLVFHGCISTTGKFAYGTKQEAIEDCEHILEVMKPGYEYCFSPTHSLQDNTIVENVFAAYATAHKAGRY